MTVNFTVVRQPTIKPDESKMNVVPDADGGMTIYWECPSDADGVDIQFGSADYATVGGFNETYYVDKGTTSKHFKASELKDTGFLRITPAAYADGYFVFNSKFVAEVNGSSTVKLTTPAKPTIEKDGTSILVKVNDIVCLGVTGNDDIPWEEQLWVFLYDANGNKIDYDIMTFDELKKYGFDRFGDYYLSATAASERKPFVDMKSGKIYLGKYAGEKITVKVADVSENCDSHGNSVFLAKYSKGVSVTTKLPKLSLDSRSGKVLLDIRGSYYNDIYDDNDRVRIVGYKYSDSWSVYAAADYYQVQCKVGCNGKWGKSKKVYYKHTGDYVGGIAETGIKPKNPGVYYYRVRAVKKTSTGDTAKSSWSKSLKITVKPNKVKGVVTSSPKTKQVKVSWSKQSKVTGYEVYCSASKDGKYRKVATVKDKSYITFKNKMTYKVNDTKKTIKLKFGKTYYYKVRAFKSVKNSNGKTKKIYGSYSRIVKASVR